MRASILALLAISASAACGGSESATDGNAGAAGAAGQAGQTGGGGAPGVTTPTSAEAKVCLDACTNYKSCADTTDFSPTFNVPKCQAQCELESVGGGVWRKSFAQAFYGMAAARGADPKCTLIGTYGFGWGGFDETAVAYSGDVAYEACFSTMMNRCSSFGATKWTRQCVFTAYAASSTNLLKFLACDVKGDCGDWLQCYTDVLAAEGLTYERHIWLGQ